MSVTLDVIYTCIWHLALGVVLHRLLKLFITGWPQIKAHFIDRWMGNQIDVSKYADSWAAVTGCTDGIGRAYTMELCRRGIRKFLLIGRNPTKLEDVAQALQKLGASEVECHVFDFATDNWSKLPEALHTYKIGILFNCAGICPSMMVEWKHQQLGLASDIIRVNAEATAQITDIVVRNMLRYDEGIIVNVGSITGWRPLFYLSSYSASKACISFMSEALHGELADSNSNIKVQCLIPGLVATKLISMEHSEADGFVAVHVDDYVRQAINIIGIVSLTAGCWQHDLQGTLSMLLPFTIFRKFCVNPFTKYQTRRIQAEMRKTERFSG